MITFEKWFENYEMHISEIYNNVKNYLDGNKLDKYLDKGNENDMFMNFAYFLYKNSSKRISEYI